MQKCCARNLRLQLMRNSAYRGGRIVTSDATEDCLKIQVHDVPDTQKARRTECVGLSGVSYPGHPPIAYE
jgi:hypothetical protein